MTAQIVSRAERDVDHTSRLRGECASSRMENFSVQSYAEVPQEPFAGESRRFVERPRPRDA